MRSGLSAFQGVVCLMGMVLLTGAKTNGCGPDFGDDGTEPPVECPDGFQFDGQACIPIDQPACPPDSIEQWVCAATEEDPSIDQDGDGTIGTEDCWLECVPVEPPVCPDGTYEQVVCEDQVEPDPGIPEDGEPNDDGGMDTPPDPGGQCWTECVPIDPTCPPDYHEEYVCEPGCDGGDNCYVTCVPDCPDVCPPGSHKETVCDDMGCYDTCIDDNQCPPGSHVEWVCDDTPDGMEGECYEVCVDDNQCGPGQHVEYVCDDMGCYETCVDDFCGPGQHVEYVCDDYGCYETCVDDGICPPGTHEEVYCDDQMGCYSECVPDDPNQCPDGTEPQEYCDDAGNCYFVCGDVPPPDPGQP